MSRVIATLARRQLGLVTREQLRARGITARSIERSVVSGRLEPVHRGVYVVAGAPDSFELRVMAAVLAAGGGAVASHRTAARLLGLGEIPRIIELSVPRAQRSRLPGVKVCRTTLPRADIYKCGPIPVTSPARTLCDLPAVLTPREVELVLDHALARKRATVASLTRLLATLPKRRGGGVLAALLRARPDGRARVESPLEDELQRVLKAAGITGWTPQLWITVRAGRYRADAAFPAERLVVETDSYLHHSSRTDWANDHVRHADLAVAGWRVLPVTKEDLRPGRRGDLIRRIEEARAVQIGQFTTS